MRKVWFRDEGTGTLSLVIFCDKITSEVNKNAKVCQKGK